MQRCENVLQIRERSYVELHDLHKFADLLIFSENPRIVGTAALNIKYIGDVDIFDQYNLHMSRENALRIYVHMIQNVARKIKLASAGGDVLFSEFKIGLDDRFLHTNAVVSFLREGKITISDETRKKLKDPVELQEFARQLSTLRWSLQEILQGYKEHLGRQISLMDALQHPTLLKCDIIIFHKDLYYEMSCVYYLMHQRQPIFPLPSYIQSIKNDIKRFHSAGNVYKVIKRLWIYERLDNASCDVLARIGDFLDSPTNALGSVVAGLDTLILVAQKTQFSSPTILNRALKSLLTLEKITWNNISESDLELVLNKFSTLSRVNNIKDFLHYAKELREFIYKYVQNNSRKFLRELTENGHV